MPTRRPRHLVTETDALAAALDAAARRWPGLSRPRLLTRLALEGHRAAEAATRESRAARLAAVERHAGVAAGTYGSGYLERLRTEWPG